MARSYRPALSRDRVPLGRRATGLLLAGGLNLLILALLFSSGIIRPVPMRTSGPLTVELLPDIAEDPEPSSATPATADATRTGPIPPKPRPPRPMPLPEPTPIERPLDMIEISPELLAASEIGGLGQAGAGSSAVAGRRAGDSEPVGRGPNGQALYAAEWVRPPTDAELGGYLPKAAPEGWGLIACRTVTGHRVEDCIELENYPRGSRLASAVRQAAWQFRVRPPRRNGREMVGEWVQIRIEYTQRTAQ